MVLTLLAGLVLVSEPVRGAQASDPPANIEAVQQLYDQSCGNRAYGAFDDVCDELRQQLRRAQSEAFRQSKRHGAVPVGAHAAIRDDEASSPAASTEPSGAR